ncbi:ABC transporter substrate-binding protein [uncultured Paraglaciecola sp.]|jgi:ABC-type sugar transport system substrate-binding protein|uniref:ABC transporter substrate-binding protein n=1 Tax=uncultured Paraglaciecola sp. TaxID=1765024 RepID=UPI0025D9CBA7|nr:ABC transporter substrate-binding protein [uncultured Paraglaciecola sp.]
MNMKVFAVAVFLLFSQIAYASKVILIVPDNQGQSFWNMVRQVSIASADSLGLQLEVVYGGDNRFTTLDVIEKIVARPEKPDYLIFRPFHGNAASIFQKIEDKGIAFVTLEQAFSGAEAIELQLPKQKYKYWLGEVAYDNANGGTLLLNALLNEQRIRQPDVKPSVTGIGGDFDNLSINRERALRNLEGRLDFRLNQVFPTYWEPKNVAANFDMMLNRYPKTNIFWCAGDQLALKTLEYYQLKFKKPIVLGGFDWMPEALLKIQRGEYTASVGGHFLMGAIALTKIFDYDHGIDSFSGQPKFYDFEVITKDNVDSYLSFMQQKKWQKVDFNNFSAVKMGEASLALTMRNIIQSLAQK